MLTGISRGLEKEGARRVREGLGTQQALSKLMKGVTSCFHTGLW